MNVIGDCSGARRPGAWGRRISARAAFTLLEVILAMALLVLLAGMTVASLWSTLESVRTKEQATRIASLLRAARADAANTGKRLRLSFDAETTQPIVSIERDGLAEPGVFEPHHAWWVKLAHLEDGIRVAECVLTGASDFREFTAAVPGQQGNEQAGMAEVTFYPDGSSDSARIVLASDDEDRPWYVEITLNGVDGSIHTRQFDPDEEAEGETLTPATAEPTGR